MTLHAGGQAALFAQRDVCIVTAPVCSCQNQQRPKSCKFQPLVLGSSTPPLLLMSFQPFHFRWRGKRLQAGQFDVQTRGGSQDGRGLPFTFCNTVRPLRGRPVNSPQIDGRCNFCLCWSPDGKVDEQARVFPYGEKPKLGARSDGTLLPP